MGVSEDGIQYIYIYICISPNGQSYREDDDELWDFGVPPTCMCFFSRQPLRRMIERIVH